MTSIYLLSGGGGAVRGAGLSDSQAQGLSVLFCCSHLRIPRHQKTRYVLDQLGWPYCALTREGIPDKVHENYRKPQHAHS